MKEVYCLTVNGKELQLHTYYAKTRDVWNICWYPFDASREAMVKLFDEALYDAVREGVSLEIDIRDKRTNSQHIWMPPSFFEEMGFISCPSENSANRMLRAKCQ